MNIILWIVFGGIAGWIASLIMGTSARMGMLMNIAVGIVGAMVGGFVMNFFGFAGVTEFNIYSFGVAILGAVILLALYKLVAGEGRR